MKIFKVYLIFITGSYSLKFKVFEMRGTIQDSHLRVDCYIHYIERIIYEGKNK